MRQAVNVSSFQHWVCLSITVCLSTIVLHISQLQEKRKWINNCINVFGVAERTKGRRADWGMHTLDGGGGVQREGRGVPKLSGNSAKEWGVLYWSLYSSWRLEIVFRMSDDWSLYWILDITLVRLHWLCIISICMYIYIYILSLTFFPLLLKGKLTWTQSQLLC